MARRRRRRVVKVEEYAKARWYISRGYPINFVAEKLQVSRNTVRSWCPHFATDRRSAAIRKRIANLPEHLRDNLVRAIFNDYYEVVAEAA
jgi:uncharacterized protein YjcR